MATAEPMNPYERYEIFGATDAELNRELREKEAAFLENFPEWEDDDDGEF